MAKLQSTVPRFIEPDFTSHLFLLAHSLFSIPTPIERVDSIAVMPGLGEHKRVKAAISAWESSRRARFLVISGTNKDEVSQPQLTIENLSVSPFFLKRTQGVMTQITASHTREQADWIVEQVRNSSITSMALFVSDWHLPRAYLTLLKSMMDSGLKIPIFPMAVGASPKELVPELNESVENLSAGEAARIRHYQEIHQIASFVDLNDYLDWLWTQTPVRSNKP